MGIVPLLPLIALAARPAGPDLDRPINLTVPATSVEKSLGALMAQSGVPLAAGEPVRRDVLVLRLDKTPLRVAMDKIAAATAAEWQATGSGYRLIRTAEGVRSLQAKEHQAEVSDIRAALAKLGARTAQPWNEESAKALAGGLDALQRSYDPQHTPQGFWSRYSHTLQKAPSGRAVERLLAVMDAEELANLPIGERVVFSTSPNRMQRPLKGDAGPTLDSYYREQVIWAAALERLPTEASGESGMSLIDDSQRTALRARPSKVLVAATRYAAGGGIALEAVIVASDGKIVGEGSASLPDAAEGGADKVPAVSGPVESTLPVSSETTALASRMSGLFTGAGESLTDESRRQILNPERTDPLALVASGLLLKAAEARHESLVACLPDSSFWTFNALARSSALKPAGLLTGMRNSGDITVEEKDGLLVVSPRRPLEASAYRLDRAVLGRFLRASASAGRADLEDLAAFAWQVPIEESGQLGSELAAAYFGRQGSETMNEWKALRLFGSLSAIQRRALQAGEIELRTLTPPQTELVRNMVFGGSSEINYEPAEPPANLSEQAQEAFDEAQAKAAEGFTDNVLREATEALPTGLDLRGTVSMTDSTKQSLFVSGRDGSESFDGEPMTAEEAAMTLFAQQRRELFPFAGNRVAEGFRTGSRRQIQIRIKLAPYLIQSVALEDQAPVAGRATSIADLPSDVKRDIQAALTLIQQQFKDAKPGDFGGPPKRSPP